MTEGKRMTYWGSGPIIALIASVWFVLVVIVDRICWPLFQIAFLSETFSLIAGLLLIVIGSVAYFLLARRVAAAVREERLITTGPFRWVRHPLYAIALFILTPGVCLLFRSWLVFTTAPVLYIAIRVGIAKEEAQLESRFGQTYGDYKAATGAVFPRLGRRN